MERAESAAESLRSLPSVDALLRAAESGAGFETTPRGELLAAARAALEQRRAAIRAGRDGVESGTEVLLREMQRWLAARATPALRRVINATGVVIHTGLGRAPLAAEALQAITDTAGRYCNLELDLASGARGDRHTLISGLLTELTGAADALVVNNNAAATLLALRALAGGRGVIVSRGELVEIGGSYRMPEIMAAAGCRMIEVGTTNRTHLADYERAVDDSVAVLLRVHTSNYRVVGFTASPTLAELVQLAQRLTPPRVVVDDLGSGLLAPDEVVEQGAGGAWDEPTVAESLRAGADLCLFSGDKLLGGPQAGIIVGSATLIARLRRDPLARAVRPDKLSLAALEATLRLYRDPPRLAERVPVWRMLKAAPEALAARAERLVRAIGGVCPELRPVARVDQSFAGGGALPTMPFPTSVVTVQPPGLAQDFAAELRRGSTPVIGRIADDMLLFDVRTIADDEIDAVCDAVARAARLGAPGATEMR